MGIIIVTLLMSVYELNTILKITRLSDDEKKKRYDMEKEKLIREAVEKEKQRLYEEHYNEQNQEKIMKVKMITSIIVSFFTIIALCVFIALYFDEKAKTRRTFEEKQKTINTYHYCLVKYPDQMKQKLEEARIAMDDVTANLDKGYDKLEGIINFIDKLGT